MNTNPMMIYFGQEFGELGMDSEGFSGRDGRTTIFDYWAWTPFVAGGMVENSTIKMLTEDQKHIYSIYQRILTLCNKEKAITEGGEFFDLMYANAQMAGASMSINNTRSCAKLEKSYCSLS